MVTVSYITYVLRPFRTFLLITYSFLVSLAAIFIFDSIPLVFPVAFVSILLLVQIFVVVRIILTRKNWDDKFAVEFSDSYLISTKPVTGVETKIPYSNIEKVKIVNQYIYFFAKKASIPFWICVNNTEKREKLKKLLEKKI